MSGQSTEQKIRELHEKYLKAMDDWMRAPAGEPQPMPEDFGIVISRRWDEDGDSYRSEVPGEAIIVEAGYDVCDYSYQWVGLKEEA
ncbi:MAG: hypothetical protein LWY06_02690 [Firmicutes bacterium]|nr:hypothetical protein [Bacillota bacterium]